LARSVKNAAWVIALGWLIANRRAALRESIGDSRPPSEQVQFQHNIVAVAQAQVDEAEFNRNWAEGRAMTLEQAIANDLADDVDQKSEFVQMDE
jgi:hypothetical protein